MDATAWAFVAASVIVTFAIAAGSIGRESKRLDSFAPRVVYSLDEAIDFVADRIPAVSQSRLTPEDVDTLLRAHMRWLHAHGLQPDQVNQARQSIDEQVVLTDLESVAYLLAEADRLEMEILDDVDVANVVNAHLDYLDLIGAVGPEADPGESAAR